MNGFAVSELLTRIRSRLNLRSNYAVCQALGFTHQSVQNWLKGRSFPDEVSSGKLAQAAGMDADVLAAYFQAMRSNNDQARETWLRVMRKLMAQGGNSADSAADGATDSGAEELGPGRGVGLGLVLMG